MGQNIDYTGAWRPLALGAKLERGATGPPPAARVEGDRVWLRGSVKVKAGQEVAEGETLFTVPATVPHPQAATRVPDGNLSTIVLVGTNGVATAGNARAEGTETILESLSYPLSE